MDKQHPIPDDAAAPSIPKRQSPTPSTTQEIAAPTSDPTNPHHQGPADSWAANERAAERRNNEPGLTNEERKRRRW
jgi:hypothetical protein